jgi:hypothetical protein
MQLQAVEHAMLDIDPDEVWLGGGNHLRDERARDTMSNAHEGLAGICLCVCEGFLEITRVGEHSSSVWCNGMELFLLAVRLEVCHREDWEL